MSDKVLSQDEISALLAAVGNDPEVSADASTPQTPSKKPGKAEASDKEGYLFPLVKTAELGKEVESALMLIFDAFTHKGSATFSNTMRTQVAFKVDEVEQIFYGDFIDSLPEPSSIWYLEVRPQNQHVAVCLSPELVNHLVAVMLGGSTSPASKTRSVITELEQSIVESVVAIFCRELAGAWSRVSEIEFNIDGRETRPRLLRVYPANEVMVTLGMSMKIAGADGTLFWGIPNGLLKTLQDSVSQQRQIESREHLLKVVQQVKDLAVGFSTSVEARLNPTGVAVSELLHLKPGDVLTLEHLVSAPALVDVNGATKFQGEIVLANERKAIRVVAAA